VVKLIVIDKQFDKVFILYNPQKETVYIGENLLLYEPKLAIKPNAVVAQVIEEKPYVPPGMKDSLLLESVTAPSEEVMTADDLGAARSELRNQKMLVAKIRLSANVEDASVDSIAPWNGWSPTPGCRVSKIADDAILRFLDLRGKTAHIALLGKTKGKSDFELNLFYLHGVSVLLGGRGTGKSHLAKSLALNLIDSGKKVVVFDINDEWSAMRHNTDGSQSKYDSKILKVDPGVNASFDLGYLGRRVFFDLMRTMRVDEASATMQTVMNYWNQLAENQELSLERLEGLVENQQQEKVKEALKVRLTQLKSTGIVAAGRKGTTFEELLKDKSLTKGGLLVVNLKDKTKITQFVIVQLFISKLADILSDPRSESLVLVLEEAQTYMAHSDIEEVVTRLRHLGLHQIYVTNTPQSLPEFILGHITNWFLFNLANEQDIEYIQNSLPLDLESANTFLKMLPPKNTLVLVNETYDGKNKNYPIIVEVEPLKYQTAGATRELFDSP
jgi:energy-coupling factor transporter ATP-binding protein EcfA2